MQDQKRLYWLMSIMMVVSLLVGGIAIQVLYRAALNEQRDWLIQSARSQARLIEAVARFDAVESANYPEGAAAATLSQIVDAHKSFHGIGQTGEFTLAKREGDQIVYLARRNAEEGLPSIPWNSKLAEPMRRALSGRSGAVVEVDYRGAEVLAAYEPIAELDLGIVAKIDMAEVRQPFIRAALLSLLAGLIVVFVASLLFLRVSNPLIESIHAQHARLRGILETAAEGIITYDQQGRIQTVNRAAERMFGRDEEALQGTQVQALVAEPSSRGWGCFLGGAASDCRSTLVRACELTGIRNDGSHFPMELATSEVDVGGQRIITGIVRDISDRKQAERQARLAEMGQMVSSVAHESRNSLQRIQAGVEMLRLDHQDEATLSELTRIEKAGRDLQRLYEELREYAAPITLERQACDLREIWRLAWANLTHLREDRSVELREDVNGANLNCAIDEYRIEQVFRNLMENSLAACDDPVVIEIACRETESEGRNTYCLTFRDNGPGLRPEQATLVFQAFYTTKSKGTGLGLAIVQRMVEAHGGQICVANLGNPGAEFVINLPRQNPAEAAS